MRFSVRNLYYLRISASTVLPLYMYLDEQHIDWMSERVLQHVLSDLRPLIPNKLIAEADAHLGSGGPSNARRGSVDVHRGDTYQFGYFLRNTDPHAMIIKTRRFTARPKPSHPNQPVLGEQHESSSKELKDKRKRTSSPKKRKAGANPTTARKRTAASKGKGKQKARDDSEDSAMETQDEDDQDLDGAAENSSENMSSVPRRSTRQRKMVAGGYHEQFENEEVVSDNEAPQDEGISHMQVDTVDALSEPEVKTEVTEPMLLANTSNTADIEPITVEDDLDPDAAASNKQPLNPLLMKDEEEEDKPKPIMSLKYRGFTIHGRCLCVIVEPYPPLRQQRSLSLVPTGLVGPRAPSIAPPDFVPSGGAAQRARTPLFLPEPDYDRERSVTPAPTQQRVLPPVPLFNEGPPESHEDELDGGMLAFSQILQSVGSYTISGLEDDDDLDGMVFLGDADEAREM